MQTLQVITFYIFSYNRGALLDNLIDSIQKFYPETPVVILDDNSTERYTLKVLKKLQAPQFTILRSSNSKSKNKHGSLYFLMNLAFKHALKNKVKYAFLLQDDLQFLYHRELIKECDCLFSETKNTIMYSPLFYQKIYLPYTKKYFQFKEKKLLFKNYGIADIGIINVQRAAKIPLKFFNKGEKYNGNFYYHKGYQLILSKSPNLCWVPWAKTYKNKRLKRKNIHTKKPFVTYLNFKKIERINQNEGIPYLEDYTTLANTKIPKPYLHVNEKLSAKIRLYLNYFGYQILQKLK